MDLQIILVVILAILSISLCVVCVYVIVILREFRNTLQKANHLIDDVKSLKHNLLSPTSTLLGLIPAVFETIKAIKSVRTIADFDEEEDEK